MERASHLGLAVDPLAVPVDCSHPAPAFGCVYVPDVLIFADAEGKIVDPWRVSMIYVHTEPDMQSEGHLAAIPDGERFLREIREKLVNVLRIAHRHGHDELVLIDVWGCGGAERPRGIEAEQVAETVRDVFVAGFPGAPDVASAFHRITLMMSGSEDPPAFDAIFGNAGAAHASSAANYYSYYYSHYYSYYYYYYYYYYY